LGLRSLYATYRRRRLYGRCRASDLGVVILRYHSVGQARDVEGYLDPGLSVSPERFRQQIRILAANFRFGKPDDLAARLAGEDDGKPLAVLTFDDGYRDNHDVAMPILLEEGAVAAFYITTGPLARGRGLWISEIWRLTRTMPPGKIDLPPEDLRFMNGDSSGRYSYRRRLTRWMSRITEETREHALDYLASRAGIPRGEGLGASFVTPDQIRAMHSAGMTIGAHTVSHPHLDHLAPEHHGRELADSKQALEDILGNEVRHFAYPNPGGGGSILPEAVASVRAAGFQTAVTSTPSPMTPDADLLRLPRVGVYRGPQEKTLFGVLARGMA